MNLVSWSQTPYTITDIESKLFPQSMPVLLLQQYVNVTKWQVIRQGQYPYTTQELERTNITQKSKK